MATYSYPPSEELMRIESKLIESMTLDDPIFQYFPITTVQDWLLRWTVSGYIGGLQQLRGLDVAAPKVEPTGETDFTMEPGVWGDQMSIREKEMTTRATGFYPGGAQGRIDIGDLVALRQEQLIGRYIRLIKYLAWTMAFTGSVSVADKHGAGGYRYVDSYSIQTYDATTWATAATATPLVDLRAAKLLARGLKANFGRGARAFANLTTINNMLANTNAADLGRVRVEGGSTLNSAEDANKVFVANDLPPITPLEDGYYDSSNTFHLFAPDGKVAIFSAPVEGTGAIGEYRMTWNAMDQAPSRYTFVNEENMMSTTKKTPPVITVEAGHNGGIVILRPWQVLVLDVS